MRITSLKPMRQNAIQLLMISVMFLSFNIAMEKDSIAQNGKEQATQNSPHEFHRKIFVPFESLDVLLDGNSNRVLLSRKEYDELLESARTREVKRAPQDSAIVSAKYTGTVSDGVAQIAGELIVEPLNSGLIEIPLQISGVAIRSATIDSATLAEAPANLWRTKTGEIVLLASGTERKTLNLEMTVPLQTTAARQTMSIQLPAPSATQFQLDVPGNVEVKSGASVIERIYNEEENNTTFDLLPTRSAMNIVMSLNNRTLKDDQVVVCRSVLIHKLTPHVQEMHATCSFDVIHGAIEELELEIPAGFQVSHVATELLSQWEIAELENGGADSDNAGAEIARKAKRLIVKLRQPTREETVLEIAAVRNEGAAGDWIAEEIRPLNVAGNVSVVGVLADIKLKSAKLHSDGVIPIDHEFLMAAIPDSIQPTRNQNPVTIVAAYYAPQPQYEIGATFKVPDPELTVKSNSRLVVENQQLELQGGLSLVSRYDTRFGFKLALPTGWRLGEMTNQQNQRLRFDRLGDDGNAEFFVHLAQQIPSDSALKVFYKATYTPPNWLEKWESKSIEFPMVSIEGQTKHSGAIAVATKEDFKLKPETVENLELLSDDDKKKFELDRSHAPLGYQFNDSDYRLTLDLQRLESTVVARTYNFFKIHPNQLTVHAELIFDVKQASEDEFQFELPLDSPKSISIRACDRPLKDFHSDDTDTARVWTVQLSKPTKGLVHLLVDYPMPMEPEALEDLKLKPIKALGVGFQSSMMAIEGSSELDIDVNTAARSVDVGELSEAVHQPGRHTLGAYSWPNEELSVVLKTARRPVYEVPSAIVQRAEMVTVVANNGKSQTAARFQLMTKQQPFLRVELPAGSTLWSVMLDGQPAKPQRAKTQGDAEALLISLVGNETGSLRDLQLVFESPANDFNFVGTIESKAPTLWLNEAEDSQGEPVPLVDLHWELMLPDGFSVSHTDGNFQSNAIVNRASPIEQLGKWIYTMGGGIRRSNAFSTSVRARNGMEQQANSWDLGMADSEMSGFKSKIAEPNTMPAAPQQAPFGETDEAQTSAEPNKSPTAKPDPFFGDDMESKLRSIELAKDLSLEREKKGKNAQQAQLWALSGLRSLDIELTDTGNSVSFYNLGEVPQLSATVVHQSRINWVAIAIAFLIAALGVLLTHSNLRTKVFFVLLILLAVGLIPLAGASFDAFKTIIDMAIMTAVFLAIYFVVTALAKLAFRSVTMIATRAALFVCLAAISLAFSNHAVGQQVVQNADELRRLIVELQSKRDVKLPDDALIIPFDPSDPKGKENADRLLLPYEHYLSLINKAELDQQPKFTAPINYVLSSAEYKTELTLENDVSISGKLVIELLTDDPVSVTLPLFGGALAEATVDGAPAKLQFMSPENPPQQQTKQAVPAASNSLIQLHLKGAGTKLFEFSVRMKPARQGGWRSIDVRLPVGVTRGLNLKSLDQPAEVRLNADADRRVVEAKPNEEIATVLNTDGSLRLQWKPATASRAIDQSLTAKSEAIFDVREDGLRLTWRVDLDFRGSERDVFTLNLPDGFLVETVSGENIRAWDVKDVKEDEDSAGNQTGKQERLNVTLLSPAKDRESFSIELSRRDFSVKNDVTQFEAPYLTVEGAALHKGIYRVRRSPIIELKTNQRRSANRIDDNQVECKIDIASVDAKSSPLGIEPFQIFEFVTTPFLVQLNTKLVPRNIAAQTQSVLRIGQSEADLETRINIEVGSRPIYQLSVDLPVDTEIRRLSAGLNESWTAEEVDGKKRIQFFFPAGVATDFSILMDASLKAFTGGDQWKIPQIKINEADQQSGQIAIQVDPAINVTSSDLVDSETILIQQIDAWLQTNQRKTTRLGLKTKGFDYAATLHFSKIKPRVTVETITNVRTTMFAVEETMLLDFDIRSAGIRQIQFELPVSMRNARIAAQLVSETLIEDIADNPNAVRVTLNLQDEVIDSYRIVIENDRQLSNETQLVPVPRILTGTTEQRFATLQNAGRDEIEVLPSDDFQRLNRQLSQFSQLKQKLSGGELTLAFAVSSKADWPELQFKTRQREVFDTVAASIEFSKTTMVVDPSGAYRALQNFQVNNRSEQYLEIELPDGARLLTVVVEGQPIKPVAWPDAKKGDRRLRIPLVKTPLGDLDYPVQLKYAGRLGELSNFNEVDFPVIETLNINVQLSQLHLRLPETHRWMSFGGTMTKVDSRGQLEESFLAYKRKQIQQLAEQIQSESSSVGKFSKSRAYSNLKKLEADLQEYQSSNPDLKQDSNAAEIEELIVGNQRAILDAQQRYSVELSNDDKAVVDNRANLNKLLHEQNYIISRNAVTGKSSISNFDDFEDDDLMTRRSGEQQIEQLEARGSNSNRREQLADKKSSKRKAENQKPGFDQAWFKRNQLGRGGQSGGQSGNYAGEDLPGDVQDEIARSGRQNLPGSGRREQQDQGQQGQQIDNSDLGIVSGSIRNLDDSISFANEAINEKFQQQSAQANSAGINGGYGRGPGEASGMMGGMGGAMGDNDEMGMGGMGGMEGGAMGMGGGAGGMGNVEQLGAIRQRVIDANGMGDLRSPEFGLQSRTDEPAVRGQSLLSDILPELEGRSGESATPNLTDPNGLSAAALTSLDIELPSRGMDFYFKSPRGGASVSVRPVETRSFSGWTSALVTVGICIAVWIVFGFILWIRKYSTTRVVFTWLAFLVGAVSFVAGILPIYGLIALLASLVLFFDWCTSTIWNPVAE